MGNWGKGILVWSLGCAQPDHRSPTKIAESQAKNFHYHFPESSLSPTAMEVLDLSRQQVWTLRCP